MPRDANLPVRGSRALDLANFFIADVQTGFGPFVAVYLTMHQWTQVQIGFALTLGTIVALISQLPAGALVDAVHNKRVAASGKRRGPAVGDLALRIACDGRADSARVLQLRAHPRDRRDQPASGRPRRARRADVTPWFASLGNGITAAVMGATGTYLSSRAVSC
jgi:hypothetical protein